MSRLWVALLASLLLFVGVVLVGPSLASRDSLPAGGPGSVIAAWRQSAPVWVVSDDDGETFVLDAVNPHRWFGMKELVGWCPSEERFVAFYDASHFDRRGAWAFGPAATDLPRYRVYERHAHTVQVGALIPPATRSSSAEAAAGGPQCWTDPSAPLRFPQPSEEPLARYHHDVPAGYEVLDGAIVIGPAGGRFCDEVVDGQVPRCAGASVPVLDAANPTPDWDSITVVRGRFLAREGSRGLHDVTVLADGWTSFN